MILKSSDATTGCVMLKKMFLKILQNSRKSPVFEPLFNKIAGLQTVIKKGIQHNLKRSPTQDFSCEYCKTFKNIYFEKCLQMAAVMALCPNIIHQASLSELKEALYSRSVKYIPIENLIKIGEFVL